MALWSIDASDSFDRNVLAEDPPKIEPIFQFSNLHSHSQGRSMSGERVRSLAFDKHNYVCTVNTSVMCNAIILLVNVYSY